MNIFRVIASTSNKFVRAADAAHAKRIARSAWDFVNPIVQDIGQCLPQNICISAYDEAVRTRDFIPVKQTTVTKIVTKKESTAVARKAQKLLEQLRIAA